MRQDALAIAVEAVMPRYRASGLMQSLCTIQKPANADTGADSGVYTDVSGLVDIPCMNAPENIGGAGVTATEVKALDQTASLELRHVLLDDYYPQLSPTTNWGDLGLIAVVDGVAFDLLGAENDSQRTQTRLKLRKVTT